MALLAVIGTFVAVAGFVVSYLIGAYPLATVDPVYVMLAWDAVAVAFLFFWLIGLVHDLQRSETLSLDKFLHLPVSLTNAFLINYVTSLVCPCMVIFLPVMIGPTLGLTAAR